MKISLQYLNDANGNISAVQLPFSQWEKVMAKMRKYEQELMVKSDLKEAFGQVAKMRKQKGKKETLADFLNEL
jgi:hypothetical protein